MEWHSLHVAYHDPDGQDALILDAVQPLLQAIASDVTAGYFVRHWRRGPHVRVNVRTDQPTFDHIVLPRAEEIVGGYLLANPSTTVLDERELLTEHTRMAELESEHGELTPFYPDNSIVPAQYEHRVEATGSAAASDLLAEYYSRTTANCLRQLAWIRAGGPRLAVAFDLMIGTAHALSGLGIRQGFISFRSHAEGFLNCFPEAQGLRARWDERYATHAQSLCPRVPAAVAIAEGAQPRDELGEMVREWLDVCRTLRPTIGELIERGDIALTKLAGPGEADEHRGEYLSRHSPFHRLLLSNGTYRDHYEGTVWFGQFRILLNYLYLHLSRLGVKPIERWFLCHMAANAVEETYGVSAMDVITQPPVLVPTA